MSSGNPDRTVGALPTEGPDPRRARFYREVASAFEILALWYTIDASEQAELMELINGYVASAYKRRKDRK